MAKSEYLKRVKEAVEKLHECKAEHLWSEPVHEVFKGKTVWSGIVEVFRITGHPKAKQCYAWSHLDGKKDEQERFIAVLEILPIDSPQAAVKAAVVSEIKNRKQAD